MNNKQHYEYILELIKDKQRVDGQTDSDPITQILEYTLDHFDAPDISEFKILGAEWRNIVYLKDKNATYGYKRRPDVLATLVSKLDTVSPSAFIVVILHILMAEKHMPLHLENERTNKLFDQFSRKFSGVIITGAKS
jgi:CRISPR/Cas system-associated endonuclease Cas3-HD